MKRRLLEWSGAQPACPLPCLPRRVARPLIVLLMSTFWLGIVLTCGYALAVPVVLHLAPGVAGVLLYHLGAEPTEPEGVLAWLDGRVDARLTGRDVPAGTPTTEASSTTPDV